jgi:hypothetical protein
LLFTYSVTTYSSCFGLVNKLLKGKVTTYLNVPELKIMQKIERLEKTSNFLRRLKDNADPAVNLKINRKIALLDSNLMINQWSVAHRGLKTIFRDFEMSYVLIKRNSPILDELKKADLNLGVEELQRVLKKLNVKQDYQEVLIESFSKYKSLKSFTKSLEIDLHTRLVKLGNNYHEYVLSRHHLENILNDATCTDGTCQRNVKSLLDRIGIQSEAEQTRFGRIIGDMKRPSFTEVSKMLNNNPIAYLTRIKKERNAELFSALKDFFLQPEIVNRMFRGFYNIPGLDRTKMVRLLKVVYDMQARTLHFPKINRIVRNTLSIDDKLPLLKELNSTVDGDEILISFARRVDDATATTWKSLKEIATSIDPDFLARMTKAEVKAKARGDISLTFQKSVVNRIATIVVAGGSIGYFYFHGDSSSQLIDTDTGEDSDQDPEPVLNNNDLPDSDEDDFIISDSDSIPLEGRDDQVIESLADELQIIASDSNSTREPSSTKSWWTKLMNFLFN